MFMSIPPPPFPRYLQPSKTRSTPAWTARFCIFFTRRSPVIARTGSCKRGLRFFLIAQMLLILGFRNGKFGTYGRKVFLDYFFSSPCYYPIIYFSVKPYHFKTGGWICVKLKMYGYNAILHNEIFCSF